MDRELKRLPDLPAPVTLVHHVMLAVHQRARLPWYRRAWSAWPVRVQAVSLGALVVLAVGLIVFAANPSFIPGVSGLGARLSQWTASVSALLQQVELLFRALVVVLNAVGRDLLVFGGLFVLAAYGCSVALFTACYRLARQRI